MERIFDCHESKELKVSKIPNMIDSKGSFYITLYDEPLNINDVSNCLGIPTATVVHLAKVHYGQPNGEFITFTSRLNARIFIRRILEEAESFPYSDKYAYFALLDTQLSDDSGIMYILKGDLDLNYNQLYSELDDLKSYYYSNNIEINVMSFVSHLLNNKNVSMVKAYHILGMDDVKHSYMLKFAYNVRCPLGQAY